MLLIHTRKVTPRIDFIFKHIFNRILGLEVEFTTVIEEFIAYGDAKISYGKNAMGNEFFVQSHGILTQSGIEDIPIQVKEWEGTPCFFQVSEKSSIPFDIFSAAFYLISRYEEYLPHVKDELARFPASESLAFREKFLLLPVVDIWAYKLREILLTAFPSLRFPEKKMQVHSLLKLERPYLYAKKGFIRSVAGYARDLTSFRFRSILLRTQVLTGTKKDPMDVYHWIVSALKNSSNRLTAFVQLGEDVSFRQGFNSNRKNFKWLIKFLNDYMEVGLLFSRFALDNLQALKEEKQRIETTTHRSLRSSVHSNYLVQLPDLYRNLVEQEIERDFSMVYEDTPGFRASTCTPFLFYDLDFEIKTPLVIHPVAFTTEGFNNKYESDSLQRIANVYSTVRDLNGCFSIFFSNEDFIEHRSKEIWRNLFSEKLHKHEQ